MEKEKYFVQDASKQEFEKAVIGLMDNGWTENRGGHRVLHEPVFFKGKEPIKRFELIVHEGAYHIQFNNYEDITVINTFISAEDGKILRRGYAPLFVRETQLRRIDSGKAENTRPVLWTINKVMYEVVIDRLRQFLRYHVSYVSMLKADIDAVLRYIEQDEPNTENAKARIQARIVLIPAAGVTEAGEGIPWGCQWNFKHAWGDGLRPGVGVTPEALDLIAKYFTVDPASEQSGQKGIFTCLDPDLQVARNVKKVRKYNDIGYEEMLDPVSGKDVVVSLYDKESNVVSRHRTMIVGDGFVASERSVDSQYLNDEGNPVFERFYNYLRPEDSSPKKDLFKVNMLVAFIGVDPEVYKYNGRNPDAFFGTEKDVISRSLQGADGCIYASEKAASLEMIRNRTYRRNFRMENYTKEFREALEKTEKGEKVRWPKDEPVAKYELCSECQHLMVPSGILNTSYSCTNCQETITSEGKTEYLPYNSDVYITGYATKTIEDSEELEQVDGEEYEDHDQVIDVFVLVPGPINGSRVVGSEGIKAVMVGCNQENIGQVFIEELGEYMNLDALIPSNANKGANSGILLSMARLGVALQSYQKGEPISLAINEHLRSGQEATAFLKQNFNITKRKIYRSKYDHATQKMSMKEEEAWVGIIQIKATEAGSEFVKTRTSDTKITFQLGTALHMLGKNELDKKLHHYSITQNPETGLSIEVVQEMIDLLYNSSHGVPEYGIEEIPNMQLAVKTVQSWMSLQKWHTLLTESRLLTDEKFTKGFMLKIPLENDIIRVRFPSLNLIKRFATPQADDHVWIPEFVASTFKLCLGLQSKKAGVATRGGKTYYSNPDFGPNTKKQVQMYHQNIIKLLIGKRGALSRMLAYRGFSHGGKEFGCHLLPTGVAVINDKRTWKRICDEAIAKGLGSEDDVKAGRINLYAFCIRDPFVWALQGASAVELWNPQKANAYFREKYGILYASFGEKSTENLDRAFFRNPVGICLNVLDMLYLYQSDADGDYRRLYIPFDKSTQGMMAEFNAQMKNYNYIDPNKVQPTDGHYHLVNTSWKWHHSYVFGKPIETEDDETGERVIELDGGEAITDKNSVSESELTYKVQKWSKKLLSNLVITGYKKKGMIATVTTSLWKLITACEYLFEDGKLTQKEKDEVIFLYQSDFLQDGCIRLLKHDGTLEGMTIEKIGKNEPIDLEDGRTSFAQDLILKHSKVEPRILKKFFEVCTWYVEALGYRKDSKNTYKRDKSADNTIGEIVLAISDFANGSRAGLINPEIGGIDPDKVKNFLSLLSSEEAKKIYHMEKFWFVLPTIQRNAPHQ